MTAGLVGDEAAARFDALTGRGTRTYDEGLQFYRQQQADLEQNNPKLALAAEVGGGLIGGLGGAGLAARGATNAGRIGRSALAGAAYGGTYAAMEADADMNTRLRSAVPGAVVGGVLGAAIPAAADGLGRGISRLWQRAATRPSVGLLQEVKNRAYKAVEEASETFTGAEMTALSQRAAQVVGNDVGYVSGVDGAVDASLRTLAAREGQDTTISQLDRVRQSLWRRLRTNPDQTQIYDIIGGIDDLIETRASTSELMGVARDANRQFSQVKLVENAFQRARDQAGSGPVSSRYRSAVAAIINNEKQSRFFDPEQIAMMRNFLNDGVAERWFRRIGKASPGENGVVNFLQLVSAVGSGGATIPIAIAGAAAKSAAERRAARGGDHILNVLSGFRPNVPLPTVSQNALRAGQGAAITAAGQVNNTSQF
ncbi:MAG: hypothetical protein U5K75_12115 [Ahrensia sp.]|nr:hypothetical protein [Ahrensia sp.]